MRGLIDTIGGLWELVRLAVISRGRIRGRYWRWRAETAFGADLDGRPASRERLRAMLDYGRWVYRTKRGR